MLPILLLLITVYNAHAQEPRASLILQPPNQNQQIPETAKVSNAPQKALQPNPLTIIQGKPHTNEFYIATQNNSDDDFNRSKQVNIEETVKQQKVVYHQPPPVTPSKSAPFISGDDTPKAIAEDKKTASVVAKTTSNNMPPKPTYSPPPPGSPQSSPQPPTTGTLRRASQAIGSAILSVGATVKTGFGTAAYHTIRGGIGAMNKIDTAAGTLKRVATIKRPSLPTLATQPSIQTLPRGNSAPSLSPIPDAKKAAIRAKWQEAARLARQRFASPTGALPRSGTVSRVPTRVR